MMIKKSLEVFDLFNDDKNVLIKFNKERRRLIKTYHQTKTAYPSKPQTYDHIEVLVSLLLLLTMRTTQQHRIIFNNSSTSSTISSTISYLRQLKKLPFSNNITWQSRIDPTKFLNIKNKCSWVRFTRIVSTKHQHLVSYHHSAMWKSRLCWFS